MTERAHGSAVRPFSLDGGRRAERMKPIASPGGVSCRPPAERVDSPLERRKVRLRDAFADCTALEPVRKRTKARAADLSESLHIVRVPKPFHTVLACAPRMWLGNPRPRLE